MKFQGPLPDRRSNLAACVEKYEGYLYIFGGVDLKVGKLNDIWKINLKTLKEGGMNTWERVQTIGE